MSAVPLPRGGAGGRVPAACGNFALHPESVLFPESRPGAPGESLAAGPCRGWKGVNTFPAAYADVSRMPGRRAFVTGGSAFLAAFFFRGAAEAAPYQGVTAHSGRGVLLGRVRCSLGRPYVLGAEGPAAFDCSGLIRWLYAGIGLSLPRLAKDQGNTGMPVRDCLRFGDVILFKRVGRGWHTGMFLARSFFVHAAGREKGVIISSLRESYFRKQFRGARRYLR